MARNGWTSSCFPANASRPDSGRAWNVTEEHSTTSAPPRISVVMSVYNDERYLRQSMESILGQEGVDLELIVIDDGSTDESPTILDEYARQDSRIRLMRQENRGLTMALIRACADAKGEFVARQDAVD